MAAQDGLSFEGTFNNGSTGLYKDQTSQAIEAVDHRTLVTSIRESFLNRIDDAYTGAKGQRAGITAPASLKDIPTVSMQLATMITFTDSTASNVVRIYELTNETTAESSPTVIRPNDYAATTNEKVWRLRVTADIDSDSGVGSGVSSVTGQSGRITSSGGSTPNIDIDAAYDALWQAAIDPYVLDSATPSTSGGTITLDCNDQVQRMFVGSASFATPKTIALSNDSNALVINFVFTITNVAGVLTFPSTFKMESFEQTALARWDDTAHTFTISGTGRHQFSATWDGTNWNMVATTPFL